MPQVIRDISKIARYGIQYRNERMEPMGLSGRHANYLTEICANPGISQEQLTQRLNINKSNVARQVVILEEGGFIQRTPCWEDKRVMKLYPTEKALALLPQIQELLDAWQAFLIQDLSEDEQVLLEEMLARIKARAAQGMEEPHNGKT